MAKTLPLSETERNALIHGLRVAADQFDKDAVTLAAEFGHDSRSVRAFKEQAVTTRAWADAIENAGTVIIQ